MAGVADIALAEATLADIEAIVGDDFECMASDGEDWMIVGRKGRGVRRSSTSHADDDELRPSSMQSSVTNDGAGASAMHPERTLPPHTPHRAPFPHNKQTAHGTIV